MKNYYYLDTNYQPTGPKTFEQLAELMRTGVITPETMVAIEGDQGWKAWREISAGEGDTLTQPGAPVVSAPASTSAPAISITETALKTVGAFKKFATDPVGGLPMACKSLDNSSAVGVGIAFGLVYTVSAYGAVKGLLPQQVFEKLPTLELLMAAGMPFLCLVVASFLARTVFRGSGTPGSDCFIAGAALLPSTSVLLLAPFLGVANFEVITILTVFAVCLTIMMLYTGCRISGLTEQAATFAVPLMLLASAWLAKILFASQVEKYLPKGFSLWSH